MERSAGTGKSSREFSSGSVVLNHNPPPSAPLKGCEISPSFTIRKQRDAWTDYCVHFDGTKTELLKNHFDKKTRIPAHHTRDEDFRMALVKALNPRFMYGLSQITS
ncbi:hypothetical protein OKW21_004652 [Catalinimonas alkaloidigena]|uniref:hypothetical protein n=1 Tax=Catalinimonas alkaloidigena TaxID=1075417 RepID=UPI002404D364|nr:hypothetical protein [Catalinimonas alkaloidigena]MDF9799389.1 hypothetical protein [Catalinimonas alkaloidigena]